jgi:hypothetical protein
MTIAKSVVKDSPHLAEIRDMDQDRAGARRDHVI